MVLVEFFLLSSAPPAVTQIFWLKKQDLFLGSLVWSCQGWLTWIVISSSLWQESQKLFFAFSLEEHFQAADLGSSGALAKQGDKDRYFPGRRWKEQVQMISLFLSWSSAWRWH